MRILPSKTSLDRFRALELHRRLAQGLAGDRPPIHAISADARLLLDQHGGFCLPWHPGSRPSGPWSVLPTTTMSPRRSPASQWHRLHDSLDLVHMGQERIDIFGIQVQVGKDRMVSHGASSKPSGSENVSPSDQLNRSSYIPASPFWRNDNRRGTRLIPPRAAEGPIRPATSRPTWMQYPSSS